jgi:hypothetical protein
MTAADNLIGIDKERYAGVLVVGATLVEVTGIMSKALQQD